MESAVCEGWSLCSQRVCIRPWSPYHAVSHQTMTLSTHVIKFPNIYKVATHLHNFSRRPRHTQKGWPHCFSFHPINPIHPLIPKSLLNKPSASVSDISDLAGPAQTISTWYWRLAK